MGIKQCSIFKIQFQRARTLIHPFRFGRMACNSVIGLLVKYLLMMMMIMAMAMAMVMVWCFWTIWMNFISQEVNDARNEDVEGTNREEEPHTRRHVFIDYY